MSEEHVVAVRTSKSSVLDAVRGEWQRLQNVVADVEDAELEEEGLDGDWTIRDIMAHIMFWEQKMIGWLLEAEGGKQPGVYADELNDDRIQEWNDANYHRQRARSLQDVMIEACEVHHSLLDVLARLPENPSDPYYEVWASGKPPWQLIAATTYEHYDEHVGWIRRFLASR